MSKSTGLAIIDITSILVNENPDYCVTVGDRFETMATAIASSYSYYGWRIKWEYR